MVNEGLGSGGVLISKASICRAYSMHKGRMSITNINKEVIFHKMVFQSLNLGPSASNSACGSTAKKVA